MSHIPSPQSGLPRPTQADAHLFLLKQLLILKQQILAFDIEFVSPESALDFTSLTSTFADLRIGGANAITFGSLFANLTNPGRLIGGIGALVPRVVENMLDAKVELDAQLRTIITEFTTAWATRMTFPLSAGSATAEQLAAAGQPMNAQMQRSLQLQAQKGKLPGPAAVAGARTAIEREVPLLRSKLEEWLEDARVKETLVGAVEDQALQSYEEFYERWLREEGGADGASGRRKKGKGRESDVWDPDTFADWTATIFAVGRIGMGDVEDEDEPEGIGSGVMSPVMSP